VAVYVPLSTLVFPAWFNFARQSAGALGVFLGAQALGAILGGLVFAAVGPRVSGYQWFVPTNLATEPGSLPAVALSFAVGLVGAGSLPIINTAYYSRTPYAIGPYRARARAARGSGRATSRPVASTPT
jgi:hypothetical protein